MHLLHALAFVCTPVAVAIATVVDTAVVTPAPIPPNNEALRRYRSVRELSQNLRERQQDSSFCFGDLTNQNAICVLTNNLFSQCDNFDQDADYASYWKCLCENGAISGQQACDWCEAAYGIYYFTGIDEQATSQCSVYSASIAPFPASYVSLVSAFNASYTGTMPTQANTGIGGRTSQTDSASGGAQTSSKNTGSISSLISTSTRTFVGGGGSIPTSTTPNAGVQSSPTSTGALKTGAAQGWKSGDAILVSVVMFVVATLCLI